MGAVTTIARRTFLIGSAAVAGGVAFGYYAVMSPLPNPLEAGMAEGEASFNPFVKISSQGVTLITPHADIGQGVVSMQALLIAEEMDLEWGQFTTGFGQPNATYFNTAMGDELIPTDPADDSFVAQRTRALGRSVGKLLGLQITGGSSSAPDSYDKLRKAGAVARETLKLAAATRLKLDIKDLKTEAGNVILPDGTKLAYTELAAECAKCTPVTDVVLRDPSEWKLLGKNTLRLDVVAKSTGTQAYGIDLVLPDMVHAAVITNPRQGGGVKGYDAAKAQAMRGVKQVLPVTGGAAVIADNTWRAFKAAEAIEFDWGDAPYPHEMADHWKVVEESFTPERLDNVWRDDGDVEAAFAASDTPLNFTYKAPYVAHAPLEPLNALILVTDARVDVWSGHQMPRFVEDKVAAITGHAIEDVHFHNQYSGGSFGHRLEMDNVKLTAEIGNKMRGTPVKLTYTREEDFAHDYPRQIGMAKGRGAVKDGKITAYDLDIATVSSSASQSGRLGISQPGPDSQIPAGAFNLKYDLPNRRVSAYKVPELAPTSSWRSVGAVTGGFFADCFLDELIHAAGLDPMQARIDMMTDPIAKQVLQKAADMSAWGRSLPENHGLGVAFVDSFNVPVAEVVEVENTPHGIKIHKVWVACDVGAVLDPINFENHVQGGVVWGLGHAIDSEITYSDGKAQQTNYHAHEGMRLYQCPEIMVAATQNRPDVRGIGEPPVPPAAPALANAIFAATGQRLREMPFNKHIKFV